MAADGGLDLRSIIISGTGYSAIMRRPRYLRRRNLGLRAGRNSIILYNYK